MQTTVKNNTVDNHPIWTLSVEKKKDFSDDVMNMVVDAYAEGKEDGYRSRQANEKAILANQLENTTKLISNSYIFIYALQNT